MKVRRHVNTYGRHVTPQIKYVDQGYKDLPKIRTNGSLHGNVCVRLQPKNGLMVNGFRFPTNWGAYAHRITYGEFSFDYPWLGKTFQVSGDGPLGMPVPKPHPRVLLGSTLVRVLSDHNTLNRVFAEARNKLKESDFNAGIALAESKKTVDLISLSVLSIARAYAYASKGKWSKAGEALGIKGWIDTKVTYVTKRRVTTGTATSRFNYKAFADANAQRWLEYQYGWKPLFADLFALQENLKNGFRTKDQSFRVVRQIKIDRPLAELYSMGGPSYALKRIEGNHTEICKVVYFQKVGNTRLLKASEYGVTNPALIAWEVVPFSFVVDWLLPIGTFLESLLVALPFNFTAGYSDAIIHWSVKAEIDVTVGQASGTMPTWTYDGFAFERKALSAWALPMPYLKNPFTTTHVVNALALLVSTRRWASR